MNPTSSQAASATLTSWHQANPLVGSGQDSRSSENGLLTIFYGNLERASQYEWLNAGRTLIDKTYISILWQAAKLPAIGVNSHEIACALDSFIRQRLQPLWAELDDLSHDAKHQLAIELVQEAAAQLFGSHTQTIAASWLLYYLCPQLPVFPLPVNIEQSGVTYADHHQQCRARLKQVLPKIHSSAPKAHFGNEKEKRIIDQVLNSSDWWLRYCFITYS